MGDRSAALPGEGCVTPAITHTLNETKECLRNAPPLGPDTDGPGGVKTAGGREPDSARGSASDRSSFHQRTQPRLSFPHPRPTGAALEYFRYWVIETRLDIGLAILVRPAEEVHRRPFNGEGKREESGGALEGLTPRNGQSKLQMRMSRSATAMGHETFAMTMSYR